MYNHVNSKNFVRIFLKRILFKYNLTINKSAKIEFIKKFFDYLDKNTIQCELFRFGEKNDGGYFIPNDLINIEACLSAGIGDLCGFENQLTLQNIYCFMADYSIDYPLINNKKISFLKKFISDHTDSKNLTASDWINTNTIKSKDYILKLDVEGDEYKIISNLSEDQLLRFRIIIIEFHHFNNILNIFGHEYVNLIFKKILKNFVIVKLHPTPLYSSIRYNDDLEIFDLYEITFLRKDRISKIKHS